MSTLTKVFILFVSLLAIFLCGLVVTFMSQADNYKMLYEEQRIKSDAAQVVAYTAEKTRAEERSASNTSTKVLLERLKDLRDTFSSQNAELAQLRQDVILESSKSDTALKLVSTMRELVQNMQNGQENLWASYDQNRANMLEAQTQVTELTRQLNNERARAGQLEDTNRRRAEQIVVLEEQVAKLNQKLDNYNLAQKEFNNEATVSKAVPTMAGVPIVGEIKELDADKASISVGSTSGVRENMRFWIVRGDNFLGNLEIIYVEADQAVGRLSNTRGVIVDGDMVTTDFN